MNFVFKKWILVSLHVLHWVWYLYHQQYGWRKIGKHFNSMSKNFHYLCHLTHWGRATHICVDKLTTIGSYNGLSPGQRQAIIWTSAGILLIGPLETNSSEILIRVQTFSFKKMHWKMSYAKLRPSCLGLNVFSVEEWCKYKYIKCYPAIFNQFFAHHWGYFQWGKCIG